MYNVHLKIMYILKLLEVMVVDNAVPILFFLIINILLSLSIAERWVLKSSIVVQRQDINILSLQITLYPFTFQKVLSNTVKTLSLKVQQTNQKENGSPGCNK